MVEHPHGGVPVRRRIDIVKPVGKYRHGIETVVQRIAVRADIDTVCQAADDKRLRAQVSEVGHKPAYEVLPVDCAMTCAHHAYDAEGVEVCRTPIVEHDRCIGTFPKPLRITVVGKCERPDSVLLHELHLGLCTPQGLIPAREGSGEPWRTAVDNVADIGTMVVYGTGIAQLTIEGESGGIIEMADTCQRHRIKGVVAGRHSIPSYSSHPDILPSTRHTTSVTALKQSRSSGRR